MSSYRSAYESYYKNINKTVKGENNKISIKDKKVDAFISSRYGANLKSKDKILENLIKRAITELTGATILLLFFVGLKYIPSTQVKELYIKCKGTIEQDFNYNGTIDAFNEMYIGKLKGKDIKIGEFTADDLKIENLKAKAANFMENLKNDDKNN
ncbi:hypothetical protein [Clostridium sp. C2-6-12]|uniref:hypothetical protein n=1 Tax=Clostridium sp. C2-6-12 TaxID=2698832 RepID=UPI00137006C0|nr:hypothetical protein [Clostridium sp. C2-6-12]